MTHQLPLDGLPPDPEDESGPGASSGMRWQGRPLRGEDGGPPDRAQRNFTDPDSRILPTRDGFVQGYNGQIAVDAAHQVIVAHRLVTNSADSRALVPLVDDVRPHLGRKPREVSGDAGFANEANLAALKERRITAYLAPGRARHGEADAAGCQTALNIGSSALSVLKVWHPLKLCRSRLMQHAGRVGAGGRNRRDRTCSA